MPKKHLSETERRDKILREAAVQFLQHGYEATTVDRIAAVAKVGKQAIYRCFDSKEDLFAAVVRTGLGQPMVELSLDMPIAEALERYVLWLLELTSDVNAFGLIRANIMVYDHFPALAAELHLDRRRRAAGAASYFAILDKQGRLACGGIDTLDLATKLGGLATQGVRPLMGFDLPTREDWPVLARWTVHLFLHGCPSGSEPPWDCGLAEGAAEQREPRSNVTMRLRPERFDNLCSTALELFFEHGFDGMSLDELVALTKVSRATIYRQFGNKEGLFRYLVEGEVYRLANEQIPSPEASDLLGGMQVLAEAMLERHLAERSLAMYRLLIREVRRVPDLARTYYDLQWRQLKKPMIELYRQYVGTSPDDCCVQAFHTLATFGVRYLIDEPPVDPSEINILSYQAARIMSEGVAEPTGTGNHTSASI